MQDLLPQHVSAIFSTTRAGHQGVLAAAATGFSDFISQQGGDPERILGHSGLDPERLACPTQSLSLIHYCQAMETAAEQLGQDNFGLHYGYQFQPQSLGLLGYIGLCSATVEQALINLVHAFPYHQHDTLTRLVDQGNSWRLDYQVRHGGILCRRQDAELTLGMFLNLLRTGLGHQWAPKEVYFEHPRPENWHEHCKLFDAPVYFDQPYNALVIPKSQLQRTMPDHNPTLLLVMQDAIQRLNIQPPRQSLAEQIRLEIQLQLPQGEPCLEQLAAKMQTSQHSVQRQLQQEGTHFSQLVDQVRQDLAQHYLKQKQISISEMALLLGYSEVSAFSRAFRRWFTLSPRQWRCQYLAHHAPLAAAS
ncbi:AraC family transcriptional regulator [Marinospirillum sp.]|uniref:AraC-like transcriptional regulator QhpR n=1 Tax=Marinospirillum sp. TaxID=2183934 RepID=UPI003A864CA3